VSSLKRSPHSYFRDYTVQVLNSDHVGLRK
jgi:hypothetical protein